MRAFLLSFLSPSGRIARWAFWWRQLLLAAVGIPLIASIILSLLPSRRNEPLVPQ